MKILQVNNVYGQQSTGKITQVIHKGLLDQGYESVAVFGRGKDTQDPGVIRLGPDWYGKWNSFARRITGMPYGGCLLSTWRLQRIIRREKPDVVHLQCINGNFVNIYRLISWLKKRQIGTVVGLHAEFMHTANCGHAFDCVQWKHGCQRCPDKKKATKSWFFDRTGASWKRMYRAFQGFEHDCIIAPVSPWTESRAKESDIMKSFRFCTVYNGVDAQDTFFYEKGEKNERPVLLNVTAHFSMEPTHPKGGWYLAQLAERMPEVEILVAGKTEPCEKIPENLKLLGEVRDQNELAALYRKANLFVLVSQRETFSMPCAESLCCGTPVVGFKAGAPEQITLPQYSEFVEFGDVDALEKTVKKWLARQDLDPTEISEAAFERYSSQTMIRAYVDLYRRLLWN